jgi:hypothetical protein
VSAVVFPLARAAALDVDLLDRVETTRILVHAVAVEVCPLVFVANAQRQLSVDRERSELIARTRKR